MAAIRGIVTLDAIDYTGVGSFPVKLMNSNTLTQLGCSGSLTIALLLTGVDRAQAAPTSPVDGIAIDSNGTKSESVSLSIVKNRTKDRARALEQFGCSCSGCQELARQLEESADNMDLAPRI